MCVWPFFSVLKVFTILKCTEHCFISILKSLFSFLFKLGIRMGDLWYLVPTLVTISIHISAILQLLGMPSL